MLLQREGTDSQNHSPQICCQCRNNMGNDTRGYFLCQAHVSSPSKIRIISQRLSVMRGFLKKTIPMDERHKQFFS